MTTGIPVPPHLPESSRKPEVSRRHDLDALRAAAMLLGIIYHASLSFALGPAWLVQDVSQSFACYLFQAFVHGFRMQLFFLVSGFFTAMLWRQKGLKSLLWHRFRRVFLPCMVGTVTVVPAMIGASSFAYQSGAKVRQAQAQSVPASSNIWTAIRLGNRTDVEDFLKSPGILESRHPEWGIVPLTWAAAVGNTNLVSLLLDKGSDVNARNKDGNTALHTAAFFGRAEVAHLLIIRGADVHAKSPTGDTPAKSTQTDLNILDAIAGYLALEADHAGVEAGRKVIVAELTGLGAGLDQSSSKDGKPASPTVWLPILRFLVDTPVFTLIWFLWFLCWLLVLFIGYSAIASLASWTSSSLSFLLSPWRYLWLIPVTLIPQWFMGFGNGEFGPDTSMGILPMPHVLAYYSLFFFFGALYYDAGDRVGALGSSWRWLLPITLLIVFPLALEFATGALGFRNQILPAAYHHAAAIVFQSLYAWLMTFGSIGMFRSLLTRENSTIRYLSDSSYWMYLAHLPLIIVAQALISQWNLPAWVKLALLSAVLTAFLLLTYQILVRYTWIGLFLNGRRTRSQKAELGAGAAPASS